MIVYFLCRNCSEKISTQTYDNTCEHSPQLVYRYGGVSITEILIQNIRDSENGWVLLAALFGIRDQCGSDVSFIYE